MTNMGLRLKLYYNQRVDSNASLTTIMSTEFNKIRETVATDL